MSRIKEIREAIDTKLDKFEAEASAIESQLNLSKDNAIEKLETQKKQFADVLTGFKGKINESKAIAQEEKTKIQNQLENLRVQLALGKAESKAAYESQKKAIEDAIKSFESSIDRELDEASDAVTSKLIGEANALGAQLDAMKVQFEREKAEGQAQFEEQKKELAAKILAFRQDLRDKKQMAVDKGTAFEGDLSTGLSQVKTAFSNLFK
jgi:hypothetical protein